MEHNFFPKRSSATAAVWLTYQLSHSRPAPSECLHNIIHSLHAWRIKLAKLLASVYNRPNQEGRRISTPGEDINPADNPEADSPQHHLKPEQAPCWAAKFYLQQTDPTSDSGTVNINRMKIPGASTVPAAHPGKHYSFCRFH